MYVPVNSRIYDQVVEENGKPKLISDYKMFEDTSMIPNVNVVADLFYMHLTVWPYEWVYPLIDALKTC